MLELTNKTFAEKIAGSTPVAVDFWAGWCMPCKIFAPVLEELSDELDGRAEFCKLDIDTHQELAIKYEVDSIPTLIVFKNGKEVDRSVGVAQKANVKAMIEQYL
jgi:thioredoxin 1